MESSSERGRLREHNRRLAQTVATGAADLHASQTRLRSSEEQLGLALEAGGIGSWTIDIASRQCACDARLERLHGRTPGSPLSIDAWKACLHPDSRNRMLALMRRAMQGQMRKQWIEYRIVWPDGSRHWLLAHGQVFFDAEGKAVRVAGFEQNIDERKALELEVLESAERQQRLIGEELHDDIQQRLAGLGLLAANLCDTLATRAAPAQEIAKRVALEIAELSGRVDRLAQGLMPMDLNGERLDFALSRLALITDTPDGLRCEFRNRQSLAVHDGVAATQLYRIAQEAVRNAAQHSGASRITLSLARVKGLTVLRIVDNGCGIQGNSTTGRGLRIMAHRASVIGATFNVAPAKPKGTRVICAFDLPQPATAAATQAGT